MGMGFARCAVYQTVQCAPTIVRVGENGHFGGLWGNRMHGFSEDRILRKHMYKSRWHLQQRRCYSLNIQRTGIYSDIYRVYALVLTVSRIRGIIRYALWEKS